MKHQSRRIHSSQELLSNVRRARELTEHYGVGDANPLDFMDQSPEQKQDWDNLLSQIK